MAYGGGGDQVEQMRKMEQERQARITAGQAQVNTAFQGFDQNFYNDRAKAYESAAQPELNREFRETGNQLGFALARRGLSDSSAAIDKRSSLSMELDKKQREVANAGKSYADQVRQGVEQSRNTLMNQVVSGGDPNIAASNALGQAAQFREPTAMQPIGNFFNDWTRNYLGNQVAQAYDPKTPSIFGT